MANRNKRKQSKIEQQDDNISTSSSSSSAKRNKKTKKDKSTKTITKTKEPTIHYTDCDTKHKYLLACRSLFTYLKTKISRDDAVKDPSKLLDLVPEEFSDKIIRKLDPAHSRIIVKYDPYLRGYRLYHYISSFEMVRVNAECKQDDILCCSVIDHNMLRKTFKILLHQMYQESLDDTNQDLDIFGREKIISVSSNSKTGDSTKSALVPLNLSGLNPVDRSMVCKDFWKETTSDYIYYVSYLSKHYRSRQVIISQSDQRSWTTFYTKKFMLKHPAQRVANKAPRKPTTRSSSSTYTEIHKLVKSYQDFNTGTSTYKMFSAKMPGLEIGVLCKVILEHFIHLNPGDLSVPFTQTLSNYLKILSGDNSIDSIDLTNSAPSSNTVITEQANNLPVKVTSREQLKEIYTDLGNLITEVSALTTMFYKESGAEYVDCPYTFPQKEIIQQVTTLYNSIPVESLRTKLCDHIPEAIKEHDEETKHNRPTVADFSDHDISSSDNPESDDEDLECNTNQVADSTVTEDVTDDVSIEVEEEEDEVEQTENQEEDDDET